MLPYRILLQHKHSFCLPRPCLVLVSRDCLRERERERERAPLRASSRCLFLDSPTSWCSCSLSIWTSCRCETSWQLTRYVESPLGGLVSDLLLFSCGGGGICGAVAARAGRGFDARGGDQDKIGGKLQRTDPRVVAELIRSNPLENSRRSIQGEEGWIYSRSPI